MAESGRELFVSFEGKACGFPASESFVRIGWLRFVSWEFAGLAAEVCDAWERLQVQRECHCQGEGDKKGV